MCWPGAGSKPPCWRPPPLHTRRRQATTQPQLCALMWQHESGWRLQVRLGCWCCVCCQAALLTWHCMLGLELHARCCTGAVLLPRQARSGCWASCAATDAASLSLFLGDTGACGLAAHWPHGLRAALSCHLQPTFSMCTGPTCERWPLPPKRWVGGALFEAAANDLVLLHALLPALLSGPYQTRAGRAARAPGPACAC